MNVFSWSSMTESIETIRMFSDQKSLKSFTLHLVVVVVVVVGGELVSSQHVTQTGQ